MRAVRRYLVGERGLDREQVYTRGYWKLGVADHRTIVPAHRPVLPEPVADLVRRAQ